MKSIVRKDYGSNQNKVEINFLRQLKKRLPNNIELLQVLADLYTKNNLIKEGLEIDLHLSRLDPEDSVIWYNLACSYSLNEKINEAFESLFKAVDLGYNDLTQIKEDQDLNILRRDSRYEEVFKRIKI